MSNLQIHIQKSEEKYLAAVHERITLEFKDVWLPSHDLEHHKRVWSNAKQLMEAFEQTGTDFSEAFVEALFFASWFHDVGLTKTLDIRHGEQSAEIAGSFLKDIDTWNNSLTEELLEAIILHDDKSYLTRGERYLTPSIYSLLTIADDMDALGATGLYRYIEIYHLRGINIYDLKNSIEKNLSSRFSFISKVINQHAALQKKIKLLYHTGLRFLRVFSIHDWQAIVQQVENKVNIHELTDGKLHENKAINHFFCTINQELKSIY